MYKLVFLVKEVEETSFSFVEYSLLIDGNTLDDKASKSMEWYGTVCLYELTLYPNLSVTLLTIFNLLFMKTSISVLD